MRLSRGFLHVGGGSGLRGLHGQPDGGGDVDVVVLVGGDGSGFVTAGGGAGFGVCFGLGVELLVLLGGTLLDAGAGRQGRGQGHRGRRLHA